ncbi:MAG: M23 family metallopeptidase [Spirochaetota bacterium]
MKTQYFIFTIFFVILCVSQLPIFSETKSQGASPQFIWPIRTANLERKLSSVFGESRRDHFHNGLDISSVNEAVLAMESGMVLYSHYKEDDPYQDDMGPGNSVWLYHGAGYLSAYYHLGNRRVDRIKTKLQVAKGDKIAITGNTGHSGGAHLHFLVAAQFGKEIVNPIKTLPPVVDSKPPRIGALVLQVDNSFTYINDGDNINISRAFPLSVTVNDAGEQPGQRRGIYRIRFTYNGKILKESRFGYISLENGEWKNEDGLRFSELFHENRYFLGELDLQAGNHTIRVDAADYNGNSATKTFHFHVNRI